MEPTHSGAGVPERQRCPETVFYDEGGIRVTDRWLVACGLRYPIYDLCEIRQVRAPHDPLTVDSGIASGTVAVGIAITATYLDPAGWLGAVAVLAVPLSLLGYGLLRRRRAYELWARYQGMTVQLLWVEDPRRFGQISRALVRAQERESELRPRG
jgi:hypothetical protein